jgi:hypothetical protein
MALDPISSAFDLGSKLIDHFFPDPTKKAEAALELLKLQQSGELAQMTAQMDINKAEAANPNMFVAGGRPFIVWIGGVAYGMNYIVGPLFTWISAWIATGKPGPFPLLDTGQLTPIVMGILGLGAYRTFEKYTDSEKNRS